MLLLWFVCVRARSVCDERRAAHTDGCASAPARHSAQPSVTCNFVVSLRLGCHCTVCCIAQADHCARQERYCAWKSAAIAAQNERDPHSVRGIHFQPGRRAVRRERASFGGLQ